MGLNKEAILEVLQNLGIKKKLDFNFIADWFIEKEKISHADPQDYFDERHTHTIGLTPENNPVEEGQYVLRYETFIDDCEISQTYARRIVKSLIDNKLIYSYPPSGYVRGILVDFTKTVDDFEKKIEESWNWKDDTSVETEY